MMSSEARPKYHKQTACPHIFGTGHLLVTAFLLCTHALRLTSVGTSLAILFGIFNIWPHMTTTHTSTQHPSCKYQLFPQFLVQCFYLGLFFASI